MTYKGFDVIANMTDADAMRWGAREGWQHANTIHFCAETASRSPAYARGFGNKASTFPGDIVASLRALADAIEGAQQ